MPSQFIPHEIPTTGTRRPGPVERTEALWQSLRGPRRLPRRTDFDPTQDDDLLPHLMILERIAPGLARIRVAGDAIGAQLGMDARGMPLGALFDTRARPAIGAQVEAAFAGPAIVEVPVQGRRRLGRGAVPGRLLILPMEDGFGAVSRALCVLAMARRVGPHAMPMAINDRAPFRCDVLGGGPTSTRTGLPDDRRAAPVPRIEMPPVTADAPTPGPAGGHLRLVVSNA